MVFFSDNKYNMYLFWKYRKAHRRKLKLSVVPHPEITTADISYLLPIFLQWALFIAAWPWENYLSSLCSVSFSVKKRNNSTYLTRWLWRLNELIFGKRTEERLTQMKSYVHFNDSNFINCGVKNIIKEKHVTVN